MKAWSFGPDKYFRASKAHILEAFVAILCFVKYNSLIFFFRLKYDLFYRFWK